MLDEDNIPQHLLNQNLKELTLINQWLGGHFTTLSGVNQIIKKNKLENKPITILDIACGAGDNLKQLDAWSKKKGYQFQFIGLDLKPEAIVYAQKNNPDLNNCQWVCASFEEIPNLNLNFDIAITALFCHHLTDKQIQQLVKMAVENSRFGMVINDLHRHPLAYHSIKLLTKLFSKSPLVKNDAPLSVLRGFNRRELTSLFENQMAEISWKWAFRWCILIHKTAVQSL